MTCVSPHVIINIITPTYKNMEDWLKSLRDFNPPEEEDIEYLYLPKGGWNHDEHTKKAIGDANRKYTPEESALKKKESQRRRNERCKEKRAEWRRNNPEKIKQYNERWREKNREYSRRYYALNKERIGEQYALNKASLQKNS